MTVEERRGGSTDKFPVGLRVLAVDDDRVCLRVLDSLLRRCQYHVTTTNQAIIALKMLRENSDKFDLVISDVQMPDMDGFRLLELVGLEMDLPVIMLSQYSDPKYVMKGIAHGACDYLLKPVRIEELKNIWQHVIRRKKLDTTKDFNTFDNTDNCDKSNLGNSEVGHGSAVTGSSDRNGKTSRKRKDQNEEDEYDCEEGHENDDPSMQKKPRVVWSVELHRKFVAAVNQLGIDKAMPKRILDLMNVEKLTRENVASHLQKYRLYLKRISNVANQQANVVAALGGKDPSYFQARPLDGLRNYHAFAGSGSLSTLASFQQSAMLGRLNSPMGSGLYSLASPRMIQLGHGQSISGNPIHDNGKPSSISFSGAIAPNWLQGMPTSLEVDQFQQHKAVLEPSNHPLSATLPDTKFPSANSNNSFVNPITNGQPHEQQHQQVQSSGFGGHSSATLTPDPFDISSNTASYLPDLHGRNDTLAGASTLSGYAATDTLPLSVPSAREVLPSTNLRECFSPLSANVEGNLHAVPSGHAAVSPLPDRIMGRDFQCQLESSSEIGFTDVRSLGTARQRLEGLNQDQMQRTNIEYDSCSVLPSHDSMNNDTQSPGFVNGIPTRAFDMTTSQACFSAPVYKQNYALERSANDQQHLESTKLQGACNPTAYNPFDDLMGAIVKQEREDALMDGDIGCDIYSLGTCM